VGPLQSCLHPVCASQCDDHCTSLFMDAEEVIEHTHDAMGASRAVLTQACGCSGNDASCRITVAFPIIATGIHLLFIAQQHK
jgi:hypothetical protein